MAKGNTEIINELYLRDSSGNRIDLMPGINLFYIGGEDFSYRGFDQLLIDGLDDDETYSLTVYQRSIMDYDGNINRGYSKSGIVVK